MEVKFHTFYTLEADRALVVRFMVLPLYMRENSEVLVGCEDARFNLNVEVKWELVAGNRTKPYSRDPTVLASEIFIFMALVD
jgi:hypothetical protein